VHACPCCGFHTLAARFAWETCPVCFWQDTVDGAENDVPLDVAQDTFARVGACNEMWVNDVRAAVPGEERASDWQTVRVRRVGEQRRLVALLETAFGDVRRDGGVTLHQMDVLDGYGTAEAMAAAEREDPEQRFQDIDDDKLTDYRLCQSLVFLDAKGFRFYIAAFLSLMVRSWGAYGYSGLWFALSASEYCRERHYALLSAAQCQCIAEVLAKTVDLGGADEVHEASKALRAHWQQYL
jgi:Cysteine-rich CPCC